MWFHGARCNLIHKAIAQRGPEVHQPCNLMLHLAFEVSIHLNFAATPQLVHPTYNFMRGLGFCGGELMHKETDHTLSYCGPAASIAS
jgi:hypothetical protein